MKLAPDFSSFVLKHTFHTHDIINHGWGLILFFLFQQAMIMIIPYYITELLFVFMSVFVYVKVSITTGPIWFLSTMMMLLHVHGRFLIILEGAPTPSQEISFSVKKNLLLSTHFFSFYFLKSMTSGNCRLMNICLKIFWQRL